MNDGTQLEFKDLPDDILLIILNYLDKSSKLKFSEVSRKFYVLIAESTLLLDDIVPVFNLFKLSVDPSIFEALSNSKRKYKKAIFTNHMIDKPLKKFLENELIYSLKIAEFRNLRINLDAFILVLNTFPNLEKIHFQNVQVLGATDGKFVLPKLLLKELVLDKTIHDDLKFLHSWTNIKALNIKFFNPIFNEIIFCQEKLEHLEIIGYKDVWMKLSKFKLKHLKVFFVEPSEDFLDFLKSQEVLESLELRSKFEFNKTQFKKFLSTILGLQKLQNLTMSLQEIPEVSDLSFIYDFKCNLKNLAINTYGNNSVKFIANFLACYPKLEFLHLISEPESQTESIAFSINQLEKLEYLKIDRCSGDFLKKLILKKVNRLKIETFIGNSEDCEEFLGRNKNIEEFRFLTSFVGDQIVGAVCGMENLRDLEIILEDPVLGIKKLLENCRNLKILRIYRDDEAENLAMSSETTDYVKNQGFQISQEAGTIHLKKSLKIH